MDKPPPKYPGEFDFPGSDDQRARDIADLKAHAMARSGNFARPTLMPSYNSLRSNSLEFASESFTAEYTLASIEAIREQEKARSTFGTPTPIPEAARHLLGTERVRYTTPPHMLRGRHVDKRALRRIRREHGRWLASMKTHCPKQMAIEPDDGEKDT